MKSFIPNMVALTILNVDYQWLKENGVDNLIFDLDDTIVSDGSYKGVHNRKNILKLFYDLSKNFNVVVATRAYSLVQEGDTGPFFFPKKTDISSKEIFVKYLLLKDMFCHVNKATTSEFKEILNKMNYISSKTAMIGNWPEDIFNPNRLGMFTILVLRAPKSKELIETNSKLILKPKGER